MAEEKPHEQHPVEDGASHAESHSQERVFNEMLQNSSQKKVKLNRIIVVGNKKTKEDFITHFFQDAKKVGICNHSRLCDIMVHAIIIC